MDSNIIANLIIQKRMRVRTFLTLRITLIIFALSILEGYCMYKAVKYYISNHHLQGLLLHRSNCAHLPAVDSRTFIGSCYTLNQALTVSAAHFKGVAACPLCSNEKDTSVLKEKKLPRKDIILQPAAKPAKDRQPKSLTPVRHLTCWH